MRDFFPCRRPAVVSNLSTSLGQVTSSSLGRLAWRQGPSQRLRQGSHLHASYAYNSITTLPKKKRHGRYRLGG